MSSCKEYVLDELIAVTAIPVANADGGDIASPFNQLTPTIDRDTFDPVMTGAITIGPQAFATEGVLVPIRHRTGKVKDEEGDSVAGRVHNVTVSCEADDRDGSVWEHLLALERTPRHLLLTYRGGTQAVVSSTEDTYLCETERDGAKTSVTFKIQCLMGVQMLVEGTAT